MRLLKLEQRLPTVCATALTLFALTLPNLVFAFALDCDPMSFDFKRGKTEQSNRCKPDSGYSYCDVFRFVYTPGDRSGYKIGLFFGSESALTKEYPITSQDIRTYTFRSQLSLEARQYQLSGVPPSDMLQLSRDDLTFYWYQNYERSGERTVVEISGQCRLVERAVPKI